MKCWILASLCYECLNDTFEKNIIFPIDIVGIQC